MARAPGLRAAHDREPLRPHARAAGAPLRAAMSPYPLILLGVLLNAAAQLLLKAGTNAVGRFAFDAGSLVPVAARLAFEPHIPAGCACYAVSLVAWLMGLSRLAVRIAYPLLSLGYVINAAAAWYLFGESLTFMRLAGIGLIIAGGFPAAAPRRR